MAVRSKNKMAVVRAVEKTISGRRVFATSTSSPGDFERVVLIIINVSCRSTSERGQSCRKIPPD